MHRLQRAKTTSARLDGTAAARVLDRVQDLENEGYEFEAAEASFDLLVRRETGVYQPLVRGWRPTA